MGFVELGVVIALAVAALLSGFVVLPRRGSWLIVAGRRQRSRIPGSFFLFGAWHQPERRVRRIASR